MYEELVGDLRYCDKGDCSGCRRYTKDTRFCNGLLTDAADAIEELSKRVVHAHWYVDDGCAYCSNCRNNFKKAIMTHARFCPMCGAKMEKPNDET